LSAVALDWSAPVGVLWTWRHFNPLSMEFLPILAHRCPVVMATVHRHIFPVGFTWSTQALIALLAGILILVRPKLLNFVIALYLILIGLIGLLHVRW